MAKIKHLSEYHKLAFELKYKGNSYQSIAETLNKKWSKSRNAKFSEQSVKDWFKESGTLCEAYRMYEEEMDEIHTETMSIIRRAGARVREQNFRLANEMLIALMGSSNDAVKLAAIKEILDRVEGKPKETFHVSEQEIAELSIEDRWNIIPYETRLQLSRGQHSKEATEKVLDWVAGVKKRAVGNQA